jgi:hypothetical protein
MEQFSLVMETGGIGSQQWRRLAASAEPIVSRGWTSRDRRHGPGPCRPESGPPVIALGTARARGGGLGEAVVQSGGGAGRRMWV